MLVTNHYYGVAWNSLTDPQSLRIRYAEPDYLNASKAAHDWVGLTLGFIQVRTDMRVCACMCAYMSACM